MTIIASVSSPIELLGEGDSDKRACGRTSTTCSLCSRAGKTGKPRKTAVTYHVGRAISTPVARAVEAWPVVRLIPQVFSHRLAGIRRPQQVAPLKLRRNQAAELLERQR
jgi:hypothetical protein